MLDLAIGRAQGSEGEVAGALGSSSPREHWRVNAATEANSWRWASSYGFDKNKEEVMVTGGILLIVGVVGLIGVYSVRPPSGLGDALMMLGQGRDFYLIEPVFFGLMAISGVISVLGLAMVVKEMGKRKE